MGKTKVKRKKHLTKDELMYHLRGMSRMRQFGVGIAYRDSALMVQHMLYHKEGFRKSQIIQLNNLILKSYNEDKSIDDINKRLMKVAGFRLMPATCTNTDFDRIGNKLIDTMRSGLLDCDIEMQRETEKYVLYTYDALMDMGYGKKRLLRVKNYIEEEAKSVTTSGLEEYQAFLFEKLGLVIELPEGF